VLLGRPGEHAVLCGMEMAGSHLGWATKKSGDYQQMRMLLIIPIDKEVLTNVKQG
jgi:hypothetical protein